jgi:RNA polymerase sigma-70 factor (ECF subfamily)
VEHADEADLLQAAQAGDIDAYTVLYERLEPDIRRFVRRIIQHLEVEDDIVQDVFIAFYRNLETIQAASLRPYIFRIARNRCYDDLRRVVRTEEMSLDDEPVELYVSFTEAHRQPLPDDLTHWMLLELEVREAMDRLPESQRQTLILFSEEGMSYAEISEIMGVSVGTVKSRLFYAKKNLRGLLRPATLAVLEDEFAPSPKRAPKQSDDHTVEMTESEFKEHSHE